MAWNLAVITLHILAYKSLEVVPEILECADYTSITRTTRETIPRSVIGTVITVTFRVGDCTGVASLVAFLKQFL